MSRIMNGYLKVEMGLRADISPCECLFQSLMTLGSAVTHGALHRRSDDIRGGQSPHAKSSIELIPRQGT